MSRYRDKTCTCPFKTRWLWAYIHLVLPLLALLGLLGAANAVWLLLTDAYASYQGYFATDAAFRSFTALLYAQAALYGMLAIFGAVLTACLYRLSRLSYVLNFVFLGFTALLIGYDTMVSGWLIWPPSAAFLMGLGVGIVWAVPNAVYFYKRRELFAAPVHSGAAVTVTNMRCIVDLPTELPEPTEEDRWLCRGCGCELVPEAKFCHECGRETEPAVQLCDRCGAELLPNAKFCRMCGAKVEEQG